LEEYSELFYLPQRSERFPLRETNGILAEKPKISVCSVFHGIIVPRKMATLVRVRTTAMTPLRLNRVTFRSIVSEHISDEESQENNEQKNTNKKDTAESQKFTPF
jgi:hypothetical protein